jgi:hypothetical protein
MSANKSAFERVKSPTGLAINKYVEYAYLDKALFEFLKSPQILLSFS